jgi:uncharacterized protein YndB with AHSA1/START domain
MMSTTGTEAVRLTRTIAAPAARVYRAWLDPEVLRQWMAPARLTVERAEVDERPGGRFSIFQTDDSGQPMGGMEAEILELTPNERLVFTWRFVGPQREDPGADSRLTITLREVEGATELTLLHERLDQFYEVMPEIAGKVGPGWNMALDNLERALA